MPKQKKIPDYRIDAIKANKLFTNEITTILIEKYHLNGPIFSITTKLNDTIIDYKSLLNYDEKTPRIKRQKEYLIDIENASKHLIKLIEQWSLTISTKLIRAIPTDPTKPVFSELEDRLLKDLKELQTRAYCAIHKTPKDIGGKPSKNALKSLIWKLADIYEEHTKLKATTGWNDVSENYQGLFFDFIQEVFEIVDVDPPIKDLGKFIRRVLEKRPSKNQ